MEEQFAKVIVPHEVVQEVEAGGRTQFAREEFRAASWMDKRATTTTLPLLLQSTLDPGEAAVIALATSEYIATMAIDEMLRFQEFRGKCNSPPALLLEQRLILCTTHACRHRCPAPARPRVLHISSHALSPIRYLNLLKTDAAAFSATSFGHALGWPPSPQGRWMPRFGRVGLQI